MDANEQVDARIKELRRVLSDGGDLERASMLCHNRHRDFEAIDEIRIKIVPRYKTSGLSGDEWRVSAFAELYFKGVKIGESRYGNMDWATRLLAAFMDDPQQDRTSSFPNSFTATEKAMCDQPGCDRKPKHWFLLRRKYSRCGSFSQGVLPTEKDYDPDSMLGYGHYVKFCDQHMKRGDSSLEDGDHNLVPITDSDMKNARVPPDAVSPAQFGGVIKLGPEEGPS